MVEVTFLGRVTSCSFFFSIFQVDQIMSTIDQKPVTSFLSTIDQKRDSNQNQNQKNQNQDQDQDQDATGTIGTVTVTK